MVVDLRFFDLRFAIAFGHLLNFVATTPSSSCVAREGRACRDRYSPPTTIYPLPPTSSTLLHGHFPRWRGRHRHESTPVATTPSSSCVAREGSRLSRPLLAAHHHLPTTTYIFYTPTHSPMRSTLHGHTSSSPTESIPCMRPPIRVPHDPYGKGIGIVPLQEVVAIGASKHKQHGGERVSDRCA